MGPTSSKKGAAYSKGTELKKASNPKTECLYRPLVIFF